MSMSSLNGLFEQIIHSEKTAEERRNFLQDLRQAVFSAQEKDKALKNSYTDLKNKLTQKICELSDKELVCKWLSSQEKIFREQQADLEKQFEELTEEQKCVLKKLQKEREEFCAKISHFTTQFGPRNCGGEERESEFTSQLTTLLKEKDQLVSGLEEVTTRGEIAKNLCREKENLQTQLDKVISENKKLTSGLSEELQKSADLEDERQTVSDIPNADPEFTSIQGQLAAERRVSMESEEKCSVLQTKLHQLHQKLWQQQQLKQRQQQKQLCNKQQQFSQNKHKQNSYTSEKEESQLLLTARPVVWQQSGNIRTEKWMDQKKCNEHRQKHKSESQKIGRTLQESEAQSGASSNLTNKLIVSSSSQQYFDQTESSLEDCSGVFFGDSDDLSVDNQ